MLRWGEYGVVKPWEIRELKLAETSKPAEDAEEGLGFDVEAVDLKHLESGPVSAADIFTAHTEASQESEASLAARTVLHPSDFAASGAKLLSQRQAAGIVAEEAFREIYVT